MSDQEPQPEEDQPGTQADDLTDPRVGGPSPRPESEQEYQERMKSEAEEAQAAQKQAADKPATSPEQAQQAPPQQ